MESLDSAMAKYGKNAIVHKVGDSREGWAKTVELLEVAAFSGRHSKDIFILDFSDVRGKGAPIAGLQGRPSSGPAPLMQALSNIGSLKGTKLPNWHSNLLVDHYLSESVLVGGARRSSRIAVKFWRDPDILDFIRVKNNPTNKKNSFLFTANNSVGVDETFWRECLISDTWASKVFAAAVENAFNYGDPGFLNLDKLNSNPEGDRLKEEPYIGSARFHPSEGAHKLLIKLAKIAYTLQYKMIVNPCGETNLHVSGGYCVIGDIALYHCDSEHEIEEAARLTVRALIRVNTMGGLYKEEVSRTNRIGVSLTGIHEAAWKMFGFGFRDLINEEVSKPFWMMLSRIALAVKDECITYSKRKGLVVPHTDTLIKPAGSVSKLFALSEGAHLPCQREYLRWVQFRKDNPLVAKYTSLGYPTKELKTYQDTTIVGFPTKPIICTLGMGDKLVTAPEASLLEQFQWLRLLEKYWIKGVTEDGNPLSKDTGGQISYTLKYDQNISLESLHRMIRQETPKVKCVTVMKNEDSSSHEYLPEEAVSSQEFNAILNGIKQSAEEDVNREHITCSGGSCPTDFKSKEEDILFAGSAKA
jgi:hypothetical protein